MEINPIKITGEWDEGYALDLHTTSSIYWGEDVYGHPVYDNQYSELGRLLYNFKYKYNYDALKDIIKAIAPFIESWNVLKTVDVVLPTPPSKDRAYQPVYEIAKEIARILGVRYSEDILQKTSSIESKGLSIEDKRQINGTIKKLYNATKEHNMLLVDDLYKSGTTLNECVRLLRNDKKIKNIYVLTITKTRT